jgi:hypothetical protein
MNDAAFGCADVDALAAELALGIVSGAERAVALNHLAVCSTCRARVEELAEVADELLLISPEREPPAGFESRVLTAMGTASAASPSTASASTPPVTPLQPRRPLRLRMLAAIAAIAAAVVLVVGAVGALVGRRLAPGPSPLTRQYIAALKQMGGSALGAEKLHAVPGGQDGGEVFAYEGHPSWLFVSLWDTSADTYTVRLVMRGGVPVTVGSLQQIGGGRTLGADIPVDITKLERVEVTDGHGVVRYRATFTLWWPKWSASGT